MNKSSSAAFRRSAAALKLVEEVLSEALSIIQVKSDNQAMPERLYVPHMEQWGTIQQVYGDGQLIGVMLDSGIFMQTSRAFTSSVETHIYKEESIKSPLTDARALQTAEETRTLQLSLF
jgi:glutaredoxin-related protein